MSGFGLPDFKNPLGTLSGSGVDNAPTRDATPPKNLVKMSIEPVGEPYNANQTLLLNPNSIAESKAANWVKHYVPGQSDPILQWISGSERTISFTATVTKDIANNPTVTIQNNIDIWTSVIDPELNEKFATAVVFNGSILEEVALTDAGGTLVSPDDTRHYWSRSISSQLEFYRKLVVPRTGSSAVLTKTPPLVYLRMGTILGTSTDSYNMKFILASYNMNITEYSPELEPTKAQVTFTFIEYVDRSKSYTPVETVRQGPPAQPTIDNSSGTFRDLRNQGLNIG